jgi:tryptophan-rich sensory protein
MTSAPTTATLTLVSIQAVQALSNISALTLTGNEEAGGALTGTMKSTLTQAMSHFGIPLYVNITSVDAAPAPEATHLRQLAAAPPQVSVSYIIAYYLESTQYSTPSELEGSVNIALSVIMDSQMFLNELRTHNVPALAGITTASLLSTSVANVALLRSPAPTPAPTTIPDTDDAYHAPNAAKLSAGLLVGFFGALAIGVSVYIYVTAPESSLGGVKYVMTNLPLVSCLATAAVAVVLVSVWASDSGGDNDFGFLQVPSWSRNVFAYHPVFMVLYFALQVQALTNWSIFSVKLNAKHAHVLVQLASAATMIAALVAVVKYMGENKSPSLVSVHSWIGAAAAAVFGFNFLWGSCRAAPAAITSGSWTNLTNSIPTRQVHNCQNAPEGYLLFNAHYFFLCFLSIIENYRYIPLSCKIANGLGIAVIVSALCALLTVLVRAQGGAPAPVQAATSAVQPASKEEVHHVEESGVDADGYTAVISAE